MHAFWRSFISCALKHSQMNKLPIPNALRNFVRGKRFSWSSSRSFVRAELQEFHQNNNSKYNENLSEKQVTIIKYLGITCIGLGTLTLSILLIALPMALPRLRDSSSLLPEKRAQIRMKLESLDRDVKRLKEQLRMRRQSEEREFGAQSAAFHAIAPFSSKSKKSEWNVEEAETASSDWDQQDNEEGEREMEEEENDNLIISGSNGGFSFAADDLLLQLLKAIPSEGIKMMTQNRQNDSHRIAKFQNKMLAQMRKRAQMLLECRGEPGQKGQDGAPGEEGVTGIAGASGEHFPFANPLFMSMGGQTPNECQLCPSGPPGPVGIVGEPGMKGDSGIEGGDGLSGAICIGEMGEPGLQGPKGVPGSKGTSGLDGGPKGAEGAIGQRGVHGPLGLPGFPGTPSFPIPGPMGMDGLEGGEGKVGKMGEAGDEGQPGVDGGNCPCDHTTTIIKDSNQQQEFFRPIIIHKLSNEANMAAVSLLKTNRNKQEAEMI